jgi:HEAT repeat protein
VFSQRILWSSALSLLLPALVRADSCADLLQALDTVQPGQRVAIVLKLGNLGRAAAEATPVLENLLHSPDERLANQAARSLAQIGEPALDALVLGAGSEEGLVSLRSLWALSLMGPDAKKAVPDLVKLLEHPQERIRGAALYALGEIGPDAKEAAAAIVKQIGTPSPMVRYNAVLALGKIGTVVVDDLRELLADKTPEVRADAARALRLFGTERAVALPDLDAALKDRSEDVRAAAALAIGGMEKAAQDRLPQIIEMLLDDAYEVQVAALQAALAIGRGDPRLTDGLREANRKGKWATPFLLKQFGKNPADGVPHLVKTLQNGSRIERMGAAYALGQIGAPARNAVPALQRALQDRSPEMRAVAVASLALIKQGVFEENHPMIREWKDAVERQVEMLNEARQQTHNTSFRAALQNIPAQRYYDSLAQVHIEVSLRKHNHRIEKQIAAMLMQAGPEALPAMVKATNASVRFKLGFC